MMIGPERKQFRMELAGNGVLHLIFDMPGRSMNVFSNAAIEELGVFADWLRLSDVVGVVIRLRQVFRVLRRRRSGRAQDRLRP